MLTIATAPLTYDRARNAAGLSPPMGWRSWNCYHADVTQAKMEAVMDAMVSRERQVDGKPTSLLDLGYDNAGLDDAWQACGTGVKGTFYSADGDPLVNLTLSLIHISEPTRPY